MERELADRDADLRNRGSRGRSGGAGRRPRAPALSTTARHRLLNRYSANILKRLFPGWSIHWRRDYAEMIEGIRRRWRRRGFVGNDTVDRRSDLDSFDVLRASGLVEVKWQRPLDILLFAQRPQVLLHCIGGRPSRVDIAPEYEGQPRHPVRANLHDLRGVYGRHRFNADR
jgi:hypothetical protein